MSADGNCPDRDWSVSAIVLAGGASTRLGTDKTRLARGQATLLDHVLTAVSHTDQRIVVGDPRSTTSPVEWAREDPPGSGPAAGIVAGLARVHAEMTVLLAGDLAQVSAGTVATLLAAAPHHDGAVIVDGTGRRQHLLSAVRTAALRRAASVRASWADSSVHELLATLDLVEVLARGPEAADVDEPGDLDLLRSLTDRPQRSRRSPDVHA
ncbi:MAG: molybdenum cofactor guanylyltransferase [Nocardioidaceae bacterium]